LIHDAWAKRQTFFPDTIAFVAPNKTLSVTVTGDKCQLNCAHCNGYYLKGMKLLEHVLSKNKGNENSYLISGGSDQDGKVPLVKKQAELVELSRRGKLNLHTGLVTEEEASCLSEFASVVSFDFIGDEKVISKVYGMNATVSDYLAAYRNLIKYVPVIPHICIGLDGGKIKSEYEVLSILQHETVKAISMIIFRPTANTSFSHCSPPDIKEVARFIATARIMYPSTPLYLGCMRPGGRYRDQVDSYAVEAGVNKIVLPAPSARKKAVDKGLSIEISEECCSF